MAIAILFSTKYIKKEIKDILLVIIGDGPEKAKLMDLTERINVKENVLFSGRISHKLLPEYYRSCDLFVNPSIEDKTGDTEGLGVSILEAMASKKPAIVSEIGGITSILQHNSALGVPSEKPEILGKKIIEVLEDPSFKDNIGEKALKTVKQHFSWPKLAQRFEEAYTSLL